MSASTNSLVTGDFPAHLSHDRVAGHYGVIGNTPGEYYARLILDDLRALAAGCDRRVLDIGCGSGIGGERLWQQAIARCTDCYIGVEPDQAATVEPVFTEVFRCRFEELPSTIAPVDLAYAVMVLEHVREPGAFFQKAAALIRPGGVFWGFTVDRRHYFAWLSRLLDALGWKDRYLDRVRGARGTSRRYDNFPTYYRCNSPPALARHAGDEFSVQTWSLHRAGQLDGYVPYRLRALSRLADRLIVRARLPGSLLLVRMVRR